MNNNLNKLYVGLVAGLIGPWIGYLLFYAILFNHKTLSSFTQMIINRGETHAGIISVCLIFNLVFFFIALRKDWFYAARGVVMAVFIYAPLVIYFKYVS